MCVMVKCGLICYNFFGENTVINIIMCVWLKKIKFKVNWRVCLVC